MRLSSAAAHRPVRLHRPLAGPKTQWAANMAGKGSKEAAEADGVDKGLTQRLIDNSSRVHKRSNSLLLTKVRAQGRRPSRRPACLVSVHQSEVGKHMAAAIGPQTASTVPPPAAARRRRSGTCLACSRFCAGRIEQGKDAMSRHPSPAGGRPVHRPQAVRQSHRMLLPRVH